MIDTPRARTTPTRHEAARTAGPTAQVAPKLLSAACGWFPREARKSEGHGRRQQRAVLSDPFQSPVRHGRPRAGHPLLALLRQEIRKTWTTGTGASGDGFWLLCRLRPTTKIGELGILDPPAEYDRSLGYYAVFFADPDGLELVHLRW
jgi:hypothetical protein